MILFSAIAAGIIFFVSIGIWAARQEKKRVKLAEEFYALPQIKALLDSGFIKEDDEISGEINGYPAGLYCWFEVTGPRYFTYIRCKVQSGFSVAYKISEKYRVNERVRIKDVNLLQQELTQIDGDTLAKSFARLQEIAALEKLEPLILPNQRP
jgi:hypothetical protein